MKSEDFSRLMFARSDFPPGFFLQFKPGVNEMGWWKVLCLIAVMGAGGTLARYGVVRLAVFLNSDFLPWGTLIVNIGGCFLAGIFYMILRSHSGISPEFGLAVMVGFCGAFTTFSTLVLETFRLFAELEYLRASLNLFLHNTLGVFAIWAGIAVGRLL